MMRIPVIPMLLCSLSLAAVAQDDMPVYNGRWTVRLDARPAGTVTLQNFEGTWRWASQAPATYAACRGKKVPITIQRTSTSALEFTAWGATAAPACPDLSINLVPAGDRVLEGSTDAGGKITLTRAARKP